MKEFRLLELIIDETISRKITVYVNGRELLLIVRTYTTKYSINSFRENDSPELIYIIFNIFYMTN